MCKKIMVFGVLGVVFALLNIWIRRQKMICVRRIYDKKGFSKSND